MAFENVFKIIDPYINEELYFQRLVIDQEISLIKMVEKYFPKAQRI